MRRRPVSWEDLALGLVAFGFAVAVWGLTHRSPSNTSSCEQFSGLHADEGRTHADFSSLAQAESVTLTHVSHGGLQVLWLFNQEVPDLGQQSVGELDVDIRQNSREMVLAIPTLGSTAWAEMGARVNIATAHALPYEVLVTYSRAQLFGLTGSFYWRAGVDYGVIAGAKSTCPEPGSPIVQTG